MTKIPIKNAIHHLISHIEKIRTVEEWALSCGYSKSYFLCLVRDYYGQTPEYLLRWIRLIKIVEQFHFFPDKICYAVAVDSGLSDENALCYFVKRYLGITPTELKNRVQANNRYQHFVDRSLRLLGSRVNNMDFYSTIHENRMVA